MLNAELEHQIVAGNVHNVYASPGGELFSLHCTVFDGHLTELCRELKIAVPTVSFAFNMSAERYGIHLPADMTEETAKRVVELLKANKIEITAEPHFGALF